MTLITCEVIHNFKDLHWCGCANIGPYHLRCTHQAEKGHDRRLYPVCHYTQAGCRSDACICMPSPLARSCTQREWACVSTLHQLELPDPDECSEYYTTVQQQPGAVVPPHSGRHPSPYAMASTAADTIRCYCHRAGRQDQAPQSSQNGGHYSLTMLRVNASRIGACTGTPHARAHRHRHCAGRRAGHRHGRQDQIQTA